MKLNNALKRRSQIIFLSMNTNFWPVLQVKTGMSQKSKTGKVFPDFHRKTHHLRPDISVTIIFPVLEIKAENERNAGGLRV